MKKLHFYLEYLIDAIAIGIVIETFLKFVGISTIQLATAQKIDTIFIIVLFLDLFYRGHQSEDRKTFVRESWLEFIGLIPFIPVLRLFRIFRIIRKSKVIKFGKMVHKLLKTNSLYYVIGVVMLLAVVGGGMLYRVEEGNITSFYDGVWLAFVTMTTVGYGDYAPITEAGRGIAIVLMIVGIGFLGVLTGSIASFFTNRKTKLEKKAPEMIDISSLNEAQRRQVVDFVGFLKHQDK